MSSQWQNHDKPKLFFNILNKKPMIILRVNRKKRKKRKKSEEKKIVTQFNGTQFNGTHLNVPILM